MVTVRCFGGATAIDEAGAEITLRSRKHTGLFLYLAAHARTTHSREELADLLWEGTGRRERHSLSQALYDIRSHAGRVMEVTTKTVRLLPERARYEMVAFEEAVGAGDHDAALELYRGEFAPNLLNLGVEAFDRWLDAERERSRVLAAIALRNAQRAAEERGDWDQMALAALRLIRQNEFDEEAHCALMRGLWMKGDPASALAHYRSLSDAFKGDPDSAIVRTYEQLRCLREVPARPWRAPLLGRESELRRLHEFARVARVRGTSLAIVGQPGVGKTSLVEEFAQSVLTAGGSVSWNQAEFEGGPPVTVGVLIQDRSPEDPEALTNRGSPKGCLQLLVSTDAPGAALACNDGRVDDVLYVEPLSLEACTTVVARTVGRDSAIAANAAHIAGGNPGLAIAVAEAWTRSGVNAATHDARLARIALNASHSVRQFVWRYLDRLAPDELRVLRILAMLTDQSRPLAHEIAGQLKLRRAVDRLVDHGYVRMADGYMRLATPLLACAIRQSLTEAEKKDLHTAVARSIENGALHWRSAAAHELAAAGKDSDAVSLGMQVATSAIVEGQPSVASEAGRLAMMVTDRVTSWVEAGFISADAELRQGSLRSAHQLLNEMASVIQGPDDRARVGILRSRLAIAERNRPAMQLLLNELEGPVEVEDDHLLNTLQLATATLRFHLAETDVGRNEATSLLTSMLASHSLGHDSVALWSEAFRTLFQHVGKRVSLDAARSLLASSQHQIGLLGPEGQRLFTAVRSVVAYRSGHLETANMILQRAWDRELQLSHDRAGSASVNNLAVTLMELGRFREAAARLQWCREIDERLDVPDHDRGLTVLNQAQCAFFAGESDTARACAREMLSLPRQPELGPYQGQARALLGLLAIREGDLHEAAREYARLEDFSSLSPPEDDSYLISWFRLAAVHAGLGVARDDELPEAARTARQHDLVNSYKLWVLAAAYSRGRGSLPPDGVETLRTMKTSGLAWFERLVRGWCPPT